MPVCKCSLCGRFMRCTNWSPGPGLEGTDTHTNPPGCMGYCVCERHHGHGTDGDNTARDDAARAGSGQR